MTAARGVFEPDPRLLLLNFGSALLFDVLARE